MVTTREGAGERQQAEVSVRCYFSSLHVVVVVFLVLFQGTKRSVQSVLFCALCSTSSLLALAKDNTSPQLDSIVRQLKDISHAISTKRAKWWMRNRKVLDQPFFNAGELRCATDRCQPRLVRGGFFRMQIP